jgi:hypothetical protein
MRLVDQASLSAAREFDGEEGLDAGVQVEGFAGPAAVLGHIWSRRSCPFACKLPWAAAGCGPPSSRSATQACPCLALDRRFA